MAAGGVIHVLPGDYGTLVITKSVQIIADGGQATIPGSASTVGSVTAGIVVNAGTADVVGIRGMIVDRHGFGGGGIGLVAGAALHLENCTVLNSSDTFGIQFRPAGNSELSVSNSTIANNGQGGVSGGGILVQPGGSAKVLVTNTRIINNRVGIEVFTKSKVIVRDSMIAHHRGFGVRTGQANAIVSLANSTVSGNSTGLRPDSGSIISRGGNVVADNVADGAFTSTVNQH